MIVDINGDGKPDVYVACDTVDNLLYVNRSKPGQILFEEMGLSAGVARDDNANANGSMGTDAVDLYGSLRPSLWCVNYENEKHALYQNDCSADRIVFQYATQKVGIVAIGQRYVGWGTQLRRFRPQRRAAPVRLQRPRHSLPELRQQQIEALPVADVDAVYRR